MKERFWIVGMNTKNFIMYVELVSMGTLNASLVHPREVFGFAIKRGGISGILAIHSHPSGDPEPSEDDITVTKRLYDAGKILGIELLDHIIVTDGPAFVSFKARGKL
jgi:DNA repair protein RadC